MTAARVRAIHTSRGLARVHLWPAVHPRHAIVLGHGAGGGVESPDIQALAERLPGAGIGVIAVEQPWRVAGRAVAERPAALDRAWLDVLEDLRANELRGRAPVVGGRSAGARVACRTAAAAGARGIVCLAFPLHPPGRPEASRAAELADAVAAGTVTVVQGGRDSFGTPDEVASACPGAHVRQIPYADHAFAVPASAPITAREALDAVADAVREAVLVDAVRSARGNAPGE